MDPEPVEGILTAIRANLTQANYAVARKICSESASIGCILLANAPAYLNFTIFYFPHLHRLPSRLFNPSHYSPRRQRYSADCLYHRSSPKQPPPSSAFVFWYLLCPLRKPPHLFRTIRHLNPDYPPISSFF